MKLKILNIAISGRQEFLNEARSSILSGKSSKEANETISFDSFETFKKLVTVNRLEILMAIARLKPQSINQLAKLLNREYPHVLRDCRSLELFGFIKLVEVDTARKQFLPKLSFEYDIIRVKSKMEEIFPISLLSNKVLLTAVG